MRGLDDLVRQGKILYVGISEWKELYSQAFMESDRAKVALLLLAAELAMTERSRQLLNSPEHHEELTELAVAKAADFAN